MTPGILVATIFVGLGATLVLDLWVLFLQRAFGVPAANYCLVGRWVLHMGNGTFRHEGIAKSAPKRAECAVGWLAHYTIGVVFALIFVQIVTPEWLRSPTPVAPLVFGIVTVAFPFLIMQPAFGLGIAASKAPEPTQARLRSLMSHAVFGAGLYLSALAVRFAVGRLS
jgi:hypothetical protein